MFALFLTLMSSFWRPEIAASRYACCLQAELCLGVGLYRLQWARDMLEGMR